jgi:hypothetical protein
MFCTFGDDVILPGWIYFADLRGLKLESTRPPNQKSKQNIRVQMH